MSIAEHTVAPGTGIAGMTEIVPGTLYAVGGSIRSDGRLSWYPATGAWLPVQGYVLRDRDELLLIDAGLSVHRDAIMTALRTLAAGTTTRRLLMTRREPDTICNLPWIVRELGMTKVMSGGDLNVLDFFTSIDEAATTGLVTAQAPAEFAYVRPGTPVTVGDLTMDVISTNLRILFTCWFYEHRTRTLFSSDTFGVLTRDQPTLPFVARPSGAEISAERIRDQMAGPRYEWLVGIDTSPLARELAAIFRDRPVERICPGFGGVIEGRGAVGALLANTFEALGMLSGMERRSPLAGFLR